METTTRSGTRRLHVRRRFTPMVRAPVSVYALVCGKNAFLYVVDAADGARERMERFLARTLENGLWIGSSVESERILEAVWTDAAFAFDGPCAAWKAFERRFLGTADTYHKREMMLARVRRDLEESGYAVWQINSERIVRRTLSRGMYTYDEVCAPAASAINEVARG